MLITNLIFIALFFCLFREIS